jgi:hypothetical protein
VTPDASKLYVTLPGREGYPDSRVAVVSTSQRRVTSWIDLRPAGQTRRTRPDGIAISPLNTAIFPRPYAVVTNEYANFASVIDTGTDRVIGEFSTGFYCEDLIFNNAGTRLYITDRFNDRVRAFAKAWRRRQHAWALDDQSSCPHTSPHRLTPAEICADQGHGDGRRVPARRDRHARRPPANWTPSRLLLGRSN